MRESRNEAAIAKITANASGVNTHADRPVINRIGVSTMQMDTVETNSGNTTSFALARIALRTSLPSAMWRLVFSTSTTALSTRMPMASARPPSVITLKV